VQKYVIEFGFDSRASDLAVTYVLREYTEAVILTFTANAGNLLTVEICFLVVCHQNQHDNHSKYSALNRTFAY
jgi:hypothetical protein